MGVERLGRYTVLRHLASGGMADVLLGRSDGIEGFARHVVIKKIRAEHAKDQRFIQMFLDEARVAASLHHQNVVQVHDIGEANGEYFFAMEYVHGEDLRTMLSTVSKAKTHMPLGYVATIISAAAAGLHYAHERRGADKKPQNIVHRDVSPSNIIIGYDASIKVLDFGIAKAAMRQVETRSGSLKGKVSYMSPEQCKGETTIDRRSDVYSLGVVLYELATTTRLFKGDSDYLMMDAIVNGKVPLPRVKRPDLPNDLSSIIMRALAVDPNRRYQTADELRIAIDQFAAKANLTTSTSAITTYMKKLFGERPEPWLDLSAAEVGSVDAEARTDAAKLSPKSWTEVPREYNTGNDEATRASPRRSGAAKVVTSELGTADTMPPPFRDNAKEAPKETTRTSTRLGWEQQQVEVGVPPMTLTTKIALVAAPVVVAVIGIGLWQFVLSGSGDKKVAASAGAQSEVAPASPLPTPPTPPPPPAVTPAPAPVAAPAPIPAPAPSPQPAPTPTPAVVAPAVVKPTGKKPAPTPAVVAKKPDAKPGPPPTAPVLPVPAPAPAPVAAPPPAQVATPTPAPVPAAPPPVIEPVIAQLSAATVSAIAADHARQLSKCETGELHGDVSVAFQIDGTGKVVKSQLSSTISNTKVAACILTSVRSWTFPKPPSGAAKGLYTINYQ